MSPGTLLDAPYENVEQIDLISDANELLSLGLTSTGSTSLTLLQPLTGTLGELATSELFGFWQGRPGIADPVKFARKLREAAERRVSARSRSPR